VVGPPSAQSGGGFFISLNMNITLRLLIIPFLVADTCGGISEGFHLAEARRVAPRGGGVTASCRTLERIRDFVHPHKIRTSQ